MSWTDLLTSVATAAASRFAAATSSPAASRAPPPGASASGVRDAIWTAAKVNTWTGTRKGDRQFGFITVGSSSSKETLKPSSEQFFFLFLFFLPKVKQKKRSPPIFRETNFSKDPL